MANSQRPARFLAGVLGTMGVLHLARPEAVRRADPGVTAGFPARRGRTARGSRSWRSRSRWRSPRTRRLGGLAAALLFLGVFPGNVKMALDASSAPAPRRALAWARLPLQWPLIAWALKVRDRA